MNPCGPTSPSRTSTASCMVAGGVVVWILSLLGSHMGQAVHAVNCAALTKEGLECLLPLLFPRDFLSCHAELFLSSVFRIMYTRRAITQIHFCMIH